MLVGLGWFLAGLLAHLWAVYRSWMRPGTYSGWFYPEWLALGLLLALFLGTYCADVPYQDVLAPGTSAR